MENQVNNNFNNKLIKKTVTLQYQISTRNIDWWIKKETKKKYKWNKIKEANLKEDYKGNYFEIIWSME
jgi:hypothetical protein